jgi:DNA-directed RNA polymerase subunit RPC12/RpoP
MPVLICPNCGRRVRVEGRQLGRALKCPKCGGRFLADPTLPPDVHVEDYAGEAPPVQRPPDGEPAEQPARPEPTVQPAYTPRPVVVVQDRIPFNPFAVISLLLGFLSLALACQPLYGFLAAVAGLVFGVVGSHYRPRTFAVVGIAFSAVGLALSLVGAYVSMINVATGR